MNLQEDGNQHSDEGTQSEGISLGSSSAYSLIETSHPLFGKIRRLWNSADESHREVCLIVYRSILRSFLFTTSNIYI